MHLYPENALSQLEFDKITDLLLQHCQTNMAKEINVPVIYGNAERWKAAQIDGVYRDKRGKIQLPLIMFKRTTIDRNAEMQMPNRLLHYKTYSSWSKTNKYDKFSLMNNFRPKKELYDITMPDYVDISYDVMIWTNFTEHMNTIVESFKWAADEYWGDKDKFKFKVMIDSFDKTQEMTDVGERIVRTEFTMVVKAYLLPDRFDNEPTTKKSISPKALITTLETDVTGRAGDMISVNDYNSNKILYDYLEINNTAVNNNVNGYIVTFGNCKIIQPPPELDLVVENTIKVYVNGVKYSKNYYTITYPNSTTLKIEFNQGLLGFPIETTDEIHIAGKFLLL